MGTECMPASIVPENQSITLFPSTSNSSIITFPALVVVKESMVNSLVGFGATVANEGVSTGMVSTTCSGLTYHGISSRHRFPVPPNAVEESTTLKYTCSALFQPGISCQD